MFGSTQLAVSRVIDLQHHRIAQVIFYYDNLGIMNMKTNYTTQQHHYNSCDPRQKPCWLNDQSVSKQRCID